MKIKAYYNEIDSFCCGWLSNLMDAGVITPGVIDNRSIEDVSPDDVAGFTRVGFFAGIGVWDYALRLARWPDDRPVWHGSCPCQPFSAAGKGAGFADERHLWPAFFHLIEQCRPAIVFGEQVASKAVEPWIDLVQADLEAVGYAFGCVPFPSASVGAPHIRDRAYWVSDASGSGLERSDKGEMGRQCQAIERSGGAIGLADSKSSRRGIFYAEDFRSANAQVNPPANPDHCKLHREQRLASSSSCPTNGFWRDTDWLFCRDGKWRPTQPEIFPLAHGATNRVGILRGAGNAINAEAAKAFIESFMEIMK